MERSKKLINTKLFKLNKGKQVKMMFHLKKRIIWKAELWRVISERNRVSEFYLLFHSPDGCKPEARDCFCVSCMGGSGPDA